jgi:hypothetical protein
MRINNIYYNQGCTQGGVLGVQTPPEILGFLHGYLLIQF